MWIKTKLNSQNEAIIGLMIQLCELRHHESSSEKMAEDFVTFHNGNLGHNNSVNTALIDISKQIAWPIMVCDNSQPSLIANISDRQTVLKRYHVGWRRFMGDFAIRLSEK